CASAALPFFLLPLPPAPPPAAQNPNPRSRGPADMASKFGLAGGIPERRVRPIWDAVDSRQYKSALKLCTALLAKHPTSPYALV
uniref:Uncharacterized protein n=1 Tax=Aegilops tauschii subsp. strangulata TaxID=200361 RepID=A0A452YRV4_AEGTS